MDPSWTPEGHPMDPGWSPKGPLMDPSLTPDGPPKDTRWTPHGHPKDTRSPHCQRRCRACFSLCDCCCSCSCCCSCLLLLLLLAHWLKRLHRLITGSPAQRFNGSPAHRLLTGSPARRLTAGSAQESFIPSLGRGGRRRGRGGSSRRLLFLVVGVPVIFSASRSSTE